MARATAPSLTGLRATSGHITLALGLVRVEVARMPMFDSPEAARPTRNNICPDHRMQLKQAWVCPGKDDAKAHPVAEPIKAVNLDGTYIDTNESEWDALKAQSDETVKIQAWMPELPATAFRSSYFLFPSVAKELENYWVLQDALKKKGGYLLAVMADDGTSKVAAVSYDEQVGFLILQTCHHDQYLRRSKASTIEEAVNGRNDADAVKARKKDVSVAFGVLESLPQTFRLDAVPDALGKAQWKYVRTKAKGKVAPATMAGGEPVEPQDLLQALKDSKAALDKGKFPTLAPSAKKKAASKSKKKAGAK